MAVYERDSIILLQPADNALSIYKQKAYGTSKCKKYLIKKGTI